MGLLSDLVGALAKCLCSGIKEEPQYPPSQGHASDVYVPPTVPHTQVSQQPAPVYPPTQPQYQAPSYQQPPAIAPASAEPRAQSASILASLAPMDPNQVNQHNEYYVDLRARANAAGDEMARCFDEAHRAYESGDGARAKELSNKGKAAQQEMERLNEQAAEWIFRENNTDSGPGEVDLHGLYVKEAIRFTDKSIQEARARGDSKIRLIVGKGLHSSGGVAKLKPAIEELIQKHGLVAELDEHNAGVLIVNIDGRPTGEGRVLRPDDITRGLERKDDGCTIM
ncbi:DUF1771-domain-containing protein [Trametes coccinea BRFM310]|uniref:DUF1771-domain-containing protein n=1 Tax=Trametes coccinea (strain BRFM310) TaxID=1353009 RepID=A0A1Y2IS56_TRAC3|nr:DUF1771-domain-containing protein [Trametes coccinea BRFM310]